MLYYTKTQIGNRTKKKLQTNILLNIHFKKSIKIEMSIYSTKRVNIIFENDIISRKYYKKIFAENIIMFLRLIIFYHNKITKINFLEYWV